MSTKDDGGPAFPVAEDHKVAADIPWTCGMSLRDYFAAKAMVIVAANAELAHTGADEWAAACYEIADSMLKAREVTP